MKKIVTFVIAFAITMGASSQELKSEDYNLPPGNQLRSGKIDLVDYSHKITEIPSKNPKNAIYDNFLKDWSDEDLKEIQQFEPKRYSYYMKAKAYHQSLSDKIKVTFTFDELWYIYMFDQDLKEKLVTIK